MDNHTAPELLEAVGIDWHKDYALVQCPQCKNHRYYCVTGNQWHRFDCSRPDTSQIAPSYNGPALGTPELDDILLVAGQRWLVSHSTSTCIDVERKIEDGCGTRPAWFYLFCMASNPGHALARAIRETPHA